MTLAMDHIDPRRFLAGPAVGRAAAPCPSAGDHQGGLRDVPATSWRWSPRLAPSPPCCCTSGGAQGEPGDPGDVPRYRHAVARPDPRLSPAAGRQAGPDRRARPAAHVRGPGRHRPQRRPLDDRHRRLLQHPQGDPAGCGAGAASRPGSPACKRFHGGDRHAPAGGRGRRRQAEVQPAGPTGTRPTSTPTSPSTTCRSIRCSPSATPLSAAGPAPARWRRGRH